MTSRAIKPRNDDRLERDFAAPPERAPSAIREEPMTPIRMLAMLAIVFLAVGGLALLMNAAGRRVMIGPTLAVIFVLVGIAGLVFHAIGEREMLLRRLYGLIGGGLFALAIIVMLIDLRNPSSQLLLPAGIPAFVLALVFNLAFVRNETDLTLRNGAATATGIAAGVLLAVGFIGGLISENFLMSRGAVYLILAFFYLLTYISMERSISPRAYIAAFAGGVVGTLMFIIALGQSLPFGDIPGLGNYLTWINDVFGWVGWTTGNPAAPFVFAYLGLEFLLLAVFVCSDSQFIGMTRRELAAYFYSPMAYIVLIALALVAAVWFLIFVNILIESSRPSPFQPAMGVPEPIVSFYVASVPTAICAMLMVPIITMRLLSEESRSGTMEVLLTAPVKESTVVLSKFFAAMRFYVLAWYSWGVFLVALAVEGGQFDYRPALTFAITLVVTGAGFVAMGMFFSSLTRNQLIAAILSFMGMMFLLFVYVLAFIAQRNQSFWADILRYVSFFDLWQETSRGVLAPRYLLFHISMAVFFLFLTIKVMESRKWR